MARGVHNHAELIIRISKERVEWVRREKRVERKEGKEEKKESKKVQSYMVVAEILETVFYKHLAFNGHLFDGSHPFLCF